MVALSFLCCAANNHNNNDHNNSKKEQGRLYVCADAFDFFRVKWRSVVAPNGSS